MEIPVLTAEIALICVIVIGAALYKTGLVGKIAREIVRVAGSNESRTIFLLSVAVAIPSGIMSNVGAVALMLPAALQVAMVLGGRPIFCWSAKDCCQRGKDRNGEARSAQNYVNCMGERSASALSVLFAAIFPFNLWNSSNSVQSTAFGYWQSPGIPVGI